MSQAMTPPQLSPGLMRPPNVIGFTNFGGARDSIGYINRTIGHKNSINMND